MNLLDAVSANRDALLRQAKSRMRQSLGNDR